MVVKSQRLPGQPMKTKPNYIYMFSGKNFQETNIYTKSDLLHVIVTKEHCQFTFL